MKKQQELVCSFDALEYLKELFYNTEDLEKFNDEEWKKLNISLNLFYGLKRENNTQWKSQFKNAIKCKTENNKLNNISIDKFDKLEAKEIIKKAFDKKKDINEKIDCLRNNLHPKLTIIYEAPPYLLLIKEKKDGTDEIAFVAEFILDDKCRSPYSNAIRGCFKNKENEISKILRDNECGFFDVIPIPLPINSDLRNKWATEDKFVFNGKRIFVYFFEWALENYIMKFKISTKEKHKIALGVPLNNAITLYEYYAQQKEVKFCNNQNILFNAPHSVNFENKKTGLWIHPFKNCIISISNTPNADLMKLAFDLN